jgi:hypothetical protein
MPEVPRQTKAQARVLANSKLRPKGLCEPATTIGGGGSPLCVNEDGLIRHPKKSHRQGYALRFRYPLLNI